MKRRTLLKGLLGATSISTANCVFRNPLISSARAQTAANPTIVVIFQRGGCDGLNVVVPYGDINYPVLRPTIGVAGPNPSDPDSALALGDPNGLNNQTPDFFGLHPSLGPLMDIYTAGDLAVLPTVQYNGATRSHFSGQHRIESGAPQDNLEGWLNRHLALTGIQGQLQAVHFGGELAQALRGAIPVQSFSYIDSFNLGLNGGDEVALTNAVIPVYNDIPSPATAYQQLVHQYGQVLFNNLGVVQSIDTSSYASSSTTAYPNSSYGRRLREISQLIKEGVGLEAATVDIGGWDTHSDQGGGESTGRQARRFDEFSTGILALYEDLRDDPAGDYTNDVVILTMTEFGRTSKENGSRGTDHGNASTWFAAGKGIVGGIYGSWPGLDENNDLYQGRYLMHTVDFRNIMGDILTHHFGHSVADLTTLLPGHSYSTLNLFGSQIV